MRHYHLFIGFELVQIGKPANKVNEIDLEIGHYASS